MLKIFFLFCVLCVNLAYSAEYSVFETVSADYPCLLNSNAIGSSEWITKEIKKEESQVVYIGSKMYKKRDTFFELTILQKGDGKIIGDMLCLYNNDLHRGCALESINIDSQFQKNGYGRLMVEYFKQRALAKGYSELSLCSLPEAVGFYKRLGFKPIGQVAQMTHFLCDLKEVSVNKECSEILKKGALLSKIDMPF